MILIIKILSMKKGCTEMRGASKRARGIKISQLLKCLMTLNNSNKGNGNEMLICQTPN